MTVSYSLKDIAEHIGADMCGDNDFRISGINTLRLASANELAFLANSAYRQDLERTKAGVVILSSEMAECYSGQMLIVANPYLGYALATALFDRAPVAAVGIHPRAVVADCANIDPSASIGPLAVIGEGVKIGANTRIGAGTIIDNNVAIGENCRIAANVSIYHSVVLGNFVTVHSGAVIGADGFGFAQHQGRWIKIHQLGGVVIGNNVEIGACTTIDRGALADTVIKDGVIVDNHVQIAHNVQVGENTAMAAFTGISGSTTIGKNCTFAGRAGCVGHITLCDGSHLTGGTILTKSLLEPGSYSSGTMFSKTREWKKNAVRFNQLDDLAQRVRKLEKKL